MTILSRGLTHGEKPQRFTEECIQGGFEGLHRNCTLYKTKIFAFIDSRITLPASADEHRRSVALFRLLEPVSLREHEVEAVDRGPADAARFPRMAPAWTRVRSILPIWS